jgi:hypothetical protein
MSDPERPAAKVLEGLIDRKDLAMKLIAASAPFAIWSAGLAFARSRPGGRSFSTPQNSTAA